MAAAVIGTLVYMLVYADPDPIPRAAAIVVLSGPGAIEPLPVDDTRDRVDRGVALWKAGRAPVLVMSGAGATKTETGLPDSHGMKAYALGLGVPEEAIVEEDRSYSTLQNAWFTAALDRIDPAEKLIVVTHRYHLPRAWASFRWAGFTDIALVAADTGPVRIDRQPFLEGVKWPANLLRAAVFRAALALGADEVRALRWLE